MYSYRHRLDRYSDRCDRDGDGDGDGERERYRLGMTVSSLV